MHTVHKGEHEEPTRPTVHSSGWYLMSRRTTCDVLAAIITSSRLFRTGSATKRLGAITMATLVRSILLVSECWVTFSRNSIKRWWVCVCVCVCEWYTLALNRRPCTYSHTLSTLWLTSGKSKMSRLRLLTCSLRPSMSAILANVWRCSRVINGEGRSLECCE